MPNVEHWQEQERRATEILPILEQTWVIAKNQNLLEATEQGWCYRGDEQTLVYDPESEQLSISANDGSWQLDWHEGLWVRSAETHITEERLAEFRELARWLETQENDRSQKRQPELSQAQAAMLLDNTACLFEYYASQENSAFKFSSDRREHFYRVQIEAVVYLISRDDESGLYSLQREDGAVLGATDVQCWKSIETWLQHLAEHPPIQAPHAAATYWEQQTMQANEVLLEAQALFTFYQQIGAVEYVPVRHSYTAAIGNYTIGYSPASDVFWLERNGERLVSATHYQQHRDDSRAAKLIRTGSQWHLTELHDLGNIAQEDVQQLREWRTWLILQSDLDPEQPLRYPQSSAQPTTRDSLQEQSRYSYQKQSNDDLDR